MKHLKKNENTADIEEHLKTLINTENHKPKLAKLPKSLNYNNPVCSKRFAGYTPSHPLYGIGNVEIGGLKTCLKDQKPIDSLNHDQMNISIYHSWSSKVKAEHQLYWNTIVSFMSKNKLPTEMLSLFYDVPNSYKKELISYKHINYISPPQVAKNMLFRARRIDNFNIFHDGWGEFEMANNRCQKMNRNWPVYAKINPDYRTNLGLNLKYKNTYFLVTGVEKDASARVAGLEIGDRIISINGHQVSTTGYRKLIEEIRGAVGDIVTITYTKENDSTNIMTAIGLELVVPNRRYKNDYAYNYYRTNETNNYQYKNFILFGPNVFPGDMKWKSSLELVNSKTGDTLKFKNIPCYNFIFYEDGDIEKFNIERQKRQKIKPEPRHTTKKPINKEKRKEQFENSIQFNTIKKDHSHYKIYQQMKESEKRLMRQ